MDSPDNLRRKIPFGTAATGLFALVLALGACGQPPEEVPAPMDEVVEEHYSDPVAVVNGLAVYESTYDSILDIMREKIPANQPNSVERYLSAKYRALEKVIDEELLYQEAIRQGFKLSDEEVMAVYTEKAESKGGEEAYLAGARARRMSKSELLNSIRKALSIQRMVESTIETGLSATEDEVRAYYDARPDLFTPEPWAKIAQIFVSAPIDAPVKDRARALSVISGGLERLKKGEPFERIASELSEDEAASLGGMLGFFKRGNLPPELDKAVFELAVGQISEIVESDKGYHIFRVYERKGGKVAPYEDVKEEARKMLVNKKRGDRLRTLVEELRETAEVERLIS